MIHPAKVAVYLMAYRRQPCRPQQDWIDTLRAKGYCVKYGSEEYGIDVARNQNCLRFLAEDSPAGREFIIMIDADMVPLPQSEGILQDNGPVVYCGYSGFQATKGHFGDDDFGSGFCRIHRSVLQKLPRPFFKMLYENDRRVGCECAYFRRNAEQAGFRPVMVGIAGHETTVVSIPKSKTEAAMVFRSHLPRLQTRKSP